MKKISVYFLIIIHIIISQKIVAQDSDTSFAYRAIAKLQYAYMLDNFNLTKNQKEETGIKTFELKFISSKNYNPEEIKEFLLDKNNGWSSRGKKLYDSLFIRSSKWLENKDETSFNTIINSKDLTNLKYDSLLINWNEEKLKIINEYQSDFKVESIQINTEVKDIITVKPDKILELNNNEIGFFDIKIGVFWLIVVAVILLFSVFIFYRLIKSFQHEEILDKKIEELKVEIKKLKSEKNNLLAQIKKIEIKENVNSRKEEMVKKNEAENRNKSNAFTEQTTALNSKPILQKVELFFSIGAKDGYFMANTSKSTYDDEKWYKITHDINSNIGEFEYLSGRNDQRAINQYDTFISPVCEIIGTLKDIKRVISSDKGIVELNGDKWVVTKKAKVIFE